MKRFVLLSMLILACSMSASAHAGVYAQRLVGCLLKEATPQDKQVFIQRFFLVFSPTKQLKDLVNVSDRKRHEITDEFSKVFNRLFTVSCQTQTEDAVNFEGKASLGLAGQALGRAAIKEFFSDPNINKGLIEVGQEVNKVQTSNPQVFDATPDFAPLVAQ